jgi:hypothetical protein
MLLWHLAVAAAVAAEKVLLTVQVAVAVAAVVV